MKPAILTLALLCSSAYANSFFDGNKLLSHLNDTSTAAIYPALGRGYIMGIADAYDNVTHCIPPGVTVGQMHDMVKNFLTNTPVIRHFPAADAVAHVLKSAWPCPKKGAGI